MHQYGELKKETETSLYASLYQYSLLLHILIIF